MALQTTRLTIRGMHCQGCARRVERALSQEPGVANAQAQLLAGQAEVTFNPALTGEERLREVVRALGYRA